MLCFFLKEMVRLHGVPLSIIFDYGPYQILRRIGKFSYELDLPNDLASAHMVFHVSFLKKCVGDPIYIVPLESLGIKESLL
ncbi:hypothetical protein MTR67_039892 [Solanum verrucosum]|uniref:Tf2-1-like SH3-like domain-containing protein n=1 Tax=Solanum verrucosum TaxID=315347 RepID=A0AAF0UI21_SOLVR|nr:hypothetical protein MTR67_039892 [Solanum verrucosum]